MSGLLGGGEALTLSDGAVVHLYRAGDPGCPRVLVSHGNGLAAGALRRLVRSMAASCEVFAFDLRNHGAGPTHELAAHHWRRMAEDVSEILAHVAAEHGPRPAFGVFHSQSALNALRAELASPGSFQGLVLLEPPFAPPPGHPLLTEQRARQEELVSAARRRRARFGSPREMFQRLRPRPQFERIDDAALWDVVGALLRAEGSAWRLACPPEYEAALYRSNVDDGFFERLAELRLPVLIVAGGDGSIRARLAAEVARTAHLDYLRLADATHMMPFELPELLASVVVAYFRGRSAACARRRIG